MARFTQSFKTFLVLLLVAAWANPSSAQSLNEPVEPEETSSFFDAKDPDLVFEMRLGGQANSDYFGSPNLSYGPDIAFRFDYIRFPNGFEYGSGRAIGFRRGWGLRGSARFIGERDSSDYPELAGLSSVDWSQELGLGIGYEQEFYRGFADVRYGVIGHHAFVGQLGADVIARPGDNWTFAFGPRLTVGSSRFIDTYFGVTPEEAAASEFTEYSASSGAVEAGLELTARYAFNELWGIEGVVKWNKYLGDAADSPIVQSGSDENLKIELGVTRRVSFDF